MERETREREREREREKGREGERESTRFLVSLPARLRSRVRSESSPQRSRRATYLDRDKDSFKISKLSSINFLTLLDKLTGSTMCCRPVKQCPFVDAPGSPRVVALDTWRNARGFVARANLSSISPASRARLIASSWLARVDRDRPTRKSTRSLA